MSHSNLGRGGLFPPLFAFGWRTRRSHTRFYHSQNARSVRTPAYGAAHAAHNSCRVPLRPRARSSAPCCSRVISRRNERRDSQDEERARQSQRVVAYAQVRYDGAEEKQDTSPIAPATPIGGTPMPSKSPIAPGVLRIPSMVIHDSAPPPLSIATPTSS